MLTLTVSCTSSVATECSWTKIITTSKDDVLTHETKVEILEHDLNYQANCPTK